MSETLQILETHTGGEPTRVVVEGFPDLGDGSLAERRTRFQQEFDQYRTAIIQEPRGSDVFVGALLTPPTHSGCCAGVIFFNNIGMLNMCGHGTIGVAIALAYLGRIKPGTHRLETPVGIVSFELLNENRVRLANVPSFRHASDIALTLPDGTALRGDIAWGGNWFFLVKEHQEKVSLENIDRLMTLTSDVRDAIQEQNITGAQQAEIDHIEIFGPPDDPENDSKNFVLCPGRAYDRSPCGTGTSAKLACLHADGRLAPGEIWRQESIVGSLFEATYQLDGQGRVIPYITGSAYVNGESTMILNPDDPFCWGMRITPGVTSCTN